MHFVSSRTYDRLAGFLSLPALVIAAFNLPFCVLIFSSFLSSADNGGESGGSIIEQRPQGLTARDKLEMNTSNLVKLCVFGADVGGRLVRLAKWVDGMPSGVKSLGFEVWAACEVLHELAAILARSQRHGRRALFDMNALKELHESIEICDEVFHEAARGILVAYDRLRVIRGSSGKYEKDGDDTRERIYLSFEERAQWPLFQARVGRMMEVLLDAKTDIVLHVLVYWVRWEGENRRRARSSLFASISSADRDALIAQLWQNKLRRGPDLGSGEESHRRMPSHNTSNDSSAIASTLASSFSTNTASGDSSPTSTTSSSHSTDSLLKRMAKRLVASFSFSKKGEDRKHQTPSSSLIEHYPSKDNRAPRSHNRGDSQRMLKKRTGSHTSARSVRTFGDASSIDGSLHGANGSYHVLGGRRYSLLSLTATSQASVQNMDARPPMPKKRSSWSAGPTRSAKEGILREWERLRSNDDDLIWQSEEDGSGQGREQRHLGRRLLFAQLKATTPAWPQRDLEQQEAIVGMLVSRWTGLVGLGEQMPWDPTSGTSLALPVEKGSTEMKFHFGKTR